jgi:hypothetical protein
MVDGPDCKGISMRGRKNSNNSCTHPSFSKLKATYGMQRIRQPWNTNVTVDYVTGDYERWGWGVSEM